MRFTAQDGQSIRVQVTTNGNHQIATVFTTGDIDGQNPTHQVYEGALDLTIAPASGRPNEFLIRCFERISGSGINGLRSTRVRRINTGDPNFFKELFATQNANAAWDDAVLETHLSATDSNDLKDLMSLENEEVPDEEEKSDY